jgi:hypothetical protein
MVSAPRHGQQLRSSADEAARTIFRNELTACLALTAPVGMTEENRRDWLAVAWETLKHIPADILTIGTQAARQKCDHPAKIVPTIIAECAPWLRRHYERSERDKPLALASPEPNYCTPEEAAEILRSVGLKSSFSPGSKPGGQDAKQAWGDSPRAGSAPENTAISTP